MRRIEEQLEQLHRVSDTSIVPLKEPIYWPTPSRAHLKGMVDGTKDWLNTQGEELAQIFEDALESDSENEALKERSNLVMEISEALEAQEEDYIKFPEKL